MSKMLSRARFIACVTALVLLATAARVEAAGEYKTIEQALLRITVDTEWIPGAAPGYVPVRWDITNLGDDRTIEIVGAGSRMSRMARFRQSRPSVRQRLQLRAGDRVRFTMAVPVSGDMDNMQFVIREDDGSDAETTTELLLPFLALGPRGMFEVAKIRPRR